MKNRFKNKLNKSNLVFGAVVTLASSAFVLLVAAWLPGSLPGIFRSGYGKSL